MLWAIGKDSDEILMSQDGEVQCILRISRKTKRPLFNSSNVKEKVSKIFDERIKFYKQSKHSIINNDRKKALSIINSYS